MEFHLLPELEHAVILGEDTLEDLGVNTNFQHLLVSASKADDMDGLNPIRCLGRLDDLCSRAKEKLRGEQPNTVAQGI